ncbi:hypothetical protein AB0K11_08515 [Mycobacterium sp. NPDC050551]|uniref:hypothetical protein n=1 Tax=Mycobacterium sp. NPDC050551 TaxID=3155407 RepID=UPI003431608D
MSGFYCTVIPTDPRWAPDDPHESAAVALFADQMYPDPGHREVRADRSDGVTLFTGGVHLERLVCPRCAEVLGQPVGPVSMEWFVEQLDRCHTEQDGYWPLQVIAPCCGAEISLNDLNDESAETTMGFALWSMEAYRPQTDNLGGEEQQQLEAVLGHPVRVIWVRI